ncbi:hypothetical protein OnM2_056056 [Erysiphe neolycopersici]|uniref:Uncharacterized protein n=1 Tax=Erysiphe neolycopersici TaxID=212602 RepID=A0A420HR07_9PEZI|nr:hypothetical protein OnM2_056056 [Erysiphe neolycopersici]
MENIKGGSVDLRLRNCIAGPQGTSNYFDDRQPRGRPKKDACKALTNLQAYHQAILPEPEPESVNTNIKIDVPMEPLNMPINPTNEGVNLTTEPLETNSELKVPHSTYQEPEVQSNSILENPITLLNSSETYDLLQCNKQSNFSSSNIEKSTVPDTNNQETEYTTKEKADDKDSETVIQNLSYKNKTSEAPNPEVGKELNADEEQLINSSAQSQTPATITTTISKSIDESEILTKLQKFSPQPEEKRQIFHLNSSQSKADRVTNNNNSLNPDITYKNLDFIDNNSKSTIDAHVELPIKNIEQPRYFTRSKKRRADVDEISIEDNRRHRKIARAFVAMIFSADNSTDKMKNLVEHSFPAEVVAGIKIPQCYSEAINDSKYGDNWRLAMSQETAGLGENGTWKEVEEDLFGTHTTR